MRLSQGKERSLVVNSFNSPNSIGASDKVIAVARLPSLWLVSLGLADLSFSLLEDTLESSKLTNQKTLTFPPQLWWIRTR